MFHGNQIGKRIIIADWEENHKLLLAITEAANIEHKSLEGRPFIEMAYFGDQTGRTISLTSVN
jgi:hypothetical protein